MSENRDTEGCPWDDDEANADKAMADLKRSMDRLRGHVGNFRSRIGDNDGAPAEAGDDSSDT
jgi:hypothetical protein